MGPIAAGAFSTIVKAKHIESGTELAVKTFAKCTGPEAEGHERELQVLRLLAPVEHAHVANLLGEYDTMSGTHAILHYCGGGTLHKYLNKLRNKMMAMREQDAAVVTAQMASAIGFIHSLGVAHRDIKPGNVLYDGRRWRLCDFGFAIICNDDPLKDKCGTLAYCAPEIVANKSYKGKAVDMWAFGCMLYEMRIGRTCFAAPDEESLRLRIKNGFKGGAESQPWLPHLTKSSKAIITQMLAKEPDKRLTCEQVLAHKWVIEFCKPTEGAAQQSGSTPSWWCDVAGKGCLRPTEGRYPAEHKCWAYNGEYTVCEVCYASGKALHMDELRLVDEAGQAGPASAVQSAPIAAAAPPAPPPPAAEAEAAQPQEVAPDAPHAAEGGETAGPTAPPPMSELEAELYQLKEKHGAGSRLEACLLELHGQRQETALVQEQLRDVQEQLAESNRIIEELRMDAH